LSNLETFTFEELEQTALATRAELKALQEGVAAYQALWKSEKANYLPQFFLGGGFRFARAPNRTDIDNPFIRDEFNATEFGGVIGFQLPLSFWQTSAKANQVKTQLVLIERQFSLTKDAISLELVKGHEAYVRATADVTSYQAMEREARSWLTASLGGYNLGLADTQTKEVLEAYVAYIQARLKRLLAVMTYYRTRAELDRLTGVIKE